METKNVLLDTQSFAANNFDMRSRPLVRLKELVQQDRARVLVSEVTVREVESRIATNVRSASTWVNKLSREARILLALDKSPFRTVKDAYKPDAITASLIDAFHKYLAEVDAEEISHGEATLSDVLNSYFEVAAPFAEGQKRKEFPDAITLSSASGWAKRNNETIYVVSGDNDLRDACELSDVLYHLETIQQLLDIESKHHSDNDWITEELVTRTDEIKKNAANIYSQGEFYLDDVDGDIEDVEVEIQDVTDFDLIEADGETAEIQMNMTLVLKAQVTYPDPNMTHYDKEDDRTYVFEWVEKKIVRRFDGTMTISLTLDRVERAIESIEYESPDSVGIDAEEDEWPYK